MNDVQDEINALETALLGTLQHDVTLASGQRLNVGGNSTFTGSVVLSSGLTVASSVTLSSGLTVSTGATVLGGTLQVNGVVTLNNQLRLKVADSTLSGGSTQFDDVALPSSGVLVRISGNSTAITIGGLDGAADMGRVIFFVNLNPAQDITLENEGAGSASTNRMQLGGANKTITAGAMIPLVYDTVTGRWRGST